MELRGRFTPEERAAIERLGDALDQYFARRGCTAHYCVAVELRDRRSIAFFDTFLRPCLLALDPAVFEGDDAAILAAVEGRVPAEVSEAR